MAWLNTDFILLSFLPLGGILQKLYYSLYPPCVWGYIKWKRVLSTSRKWNYKWLIMSALSWGNTTQVTFSNPLIKAVYGISIEWRLLKRMPSIPWILLLSLSPHPAALSSTLSSIWTLPFNCHQFIIWYQFLASSLALLKRVEKIAMPLLFSPTNGFSKFPSDFAIKTI